MFKCLIFLSFFSFSVLATVFTPIPIKQQILESAGFIKGEVLSQITEDHPEMGKITKVSFKADAWSGGGVQNAHIEVYYPGGAGPGEATKVHGTPKFSLGEKVVVFYKEFQGKHWVSNLALGKFSIKKLGRKEFMVNDIFPQIPNVGQMPLKKFFHIASQTSKTPLKKRLKTKYERGVHKSVHSIEPSKRKRRPASVPHAPSKKPSPAWLALLLGLAGFFIRIIKGRRKQ